MVLISSEYRFVILVPHQETEIMESLLQDVEQFLSRYCKAELIAKSSDILNKFDEVQRKPIPSIVSAPVLSEFVRYAEIPLHCMA